MYNLNNQKERNEYAKSDAEKSLKGRQYGYRSSAERAINNQVNKYGALFVEGQRYAINQLDDGCFEII
jgi:hypothetical protein